MAEKETHLKNAVSSQTSRGDLSRSEASHEDAEPEAIQGMREQCESLHAALRDIAQAVIQDAEGSITESNMPLEDTFTTDGGFASPFAKSTPLR